MKLNISIQTYTFIKKINKNISIWNMKHLIYTFFRSPIGVALMGLILKFYMISNVEGY